MRKIVGMLVLALTAATLVACGSQASASTQAGGAAAATAQPYTSVVLATTYENALPASSQLALGTLKLERTPNAVTPAQAKNLLPLWQAIQSGALQGDAETNAVLRQIEGAMTAEQLAAIAAMQLTSADQSSWAQQAGVSFGPPPGATGGQNPPSGPGNLSEAERAAMRATREAGGQGGFPQGGPGNLSEEERAAMRATAEAGGMTFGGGQAGGSQGSLTFLARALIELLTQRAA